MTWNVPSVFIIMGDCDFYDEVDALSNAVTVTLFWGRIEGSPHGLPAKRKAAAATLQVTWSFFRCEPCVLFEKEAARLGLLPGVASHSFLLCTDSKCWNA